MQDNLTPGSGCPSDFLSPNASRRWREGAHEARGLQLQSHPQGATYTTPNWPTQTATKPQATGAWPPSGTCHTLSSVERKK